MARFNPNYRIHNISWSINQIKFLLAIAQDKQSSSFVFYATLECRKIIERIEYEILVIPNKKIHNDFNEEIKKFKGIQKVNTKLKTLRFRYQTFTEAYSKAILEDFPINAFNLTLSESFEKRLSKYIHTYYRSDDELQYNNDFIQNGINLVIEVVQYLEKFRKNGEYVFGSLSFSTLKGGIKKEFENWLNGVDDDTESLKNRLDEINRTENNNFKYQV